MTKTTPDYTKMSGGELIRACGVDSKKWAEAFLQYNPEVNTDPDNLSGWFANAMMAEYDALRDHNNFQSGPVNASFKKAYINADGDIGRVIVSAGNSLVEMTYPQAVALANEILRRCQ